MALCFVDTCNFSRDDNSCKQRKGCSLQLRWQTRRLRCNQWGNCTSLYMDLNRRNHQTPRRQSKMNHPSGLCHQTLSTHRIGNRISRNAQPNWSGQSLGITYSPQKSVTPF